MRVGHPGFLSPTRGRCTHDRRDGANPLGDLQIERAALREQQAEFEAWTAAERKKILLRLMAVDVTALLIAAATKSRRTLSGVRSFV
jgi:hypothetical protein